jgi:phage/plasmid-associated DNA primase
VGVAVERRIRAVPFEVQFMTQKDYDNQEDKTNIRLLTRIIKRIQEDETGSL